MSYKKRARVQFGSRVCLIFLLLTASSFYAGGQTKPPKAVPDAPTADSARRPSADETFELNIDERRFSEQNFEAATGVGTDKDSQGLNLQIGVALSADRIDVLLRNVRGSVRFRGTLDRVFEMMSNRRAPAPK